MIDQQVRQLVIREVAAVETDHGDLESVVRRGERRRSLTRTARIAGALLGTAVLIGLLSMWQPPGNGIADSMPTPAPGLTVPEAVPSETVTTAVETDSTQPTTTTVVIDLTEPSQSEMDAVRDGVIAALADLPFGMRIEPVAEVVAAEGAWMLSRPSQELIEATLGDGCGLGDLDGEYPTELICTVEYGEVILVDKHGQIARAYPMPGAIPSWIHLTESNVYAGRVGDGGLPDSTLVRIDRDSFEATVVVIPAVSDGLEDWPPGWLIADADQRTRYQSLVGFAPEHDGIEVTSWIGEVRVDIAGVESMLDEFDR